jgi:hypothetical protein
VSSGRDDDALTWDGDDDPTLLPSGRSADSAEALPSGYRAVGKPGRVDDDRDSDADSRTSTAGVDDAEDEAASGMGNVALVAFGLVGGVYLLYSIGWLIGGLRLQAVADLLITGGGSAAPPLWSVGNTIMLVLAVAAPAIWFGTTLLLTRAAKPWLRWLFLVAGVVLLVPWPFVMVGAVGA